MILYYIILYYIISYDIILYEDLIVMRNKEKKNVSSRLGAQEHGARTAQAP